MDEGIEWPGKSVLAARHDDDDDNDSSKLQFMVTIQNIDNLHSYIVSSIPIID